MALLLLLLAAFDIACIKTLVAKRNVQHKRVPWANFFVSLLCSELAWLWLVVQVLLVIILVNVGAAAPWYGKLALVAVFISWVYLYRSVRTSMQAGPVVEAALYEGLGSNYRSEIPADATAKLRQSVEFADWRNPVAYKNQNVEVIRNIAYGPAGQRQQLDIYRPKNMPDKPCPVMLQIHGGAWMFGDKAHQALPLMNLLASRGWICVAANYRLSPSVGFPTHLEDCKAALCWIREHGSEYGMNPEFVAVTGGSAGGHLSALMGLTANMKELQTDKPDVDTSIQACVPFYGVYDLLVRHDQHLNKAVYLDFLTNKVIHESIEVNPALWELASPLSHIHAGAPPFMAVHGEMDSLALINDGRVFSEKLREISNNPVVFLELPETEHAFDGFHSPRTEYTINGIHRFLEWALARHEQGNNAAKVAGE